MTAPLPAFVDCETDGVHPGRKAWEIAVIRREHDGPDFTWSWFVDINLDTADPFALRIGGFYDRHPLGRYLSGLESKEPEYSVAYADEYESARRVARLTHGRQPWGAVPSFDTETLAGLLRDNFLTPAWNHRVRCVETLTAGHLGREVGGLSDCAKELGIVVPEGAAHTALGDAQTAREIHDFIMTGGGDV